MRATALGTHIGAPVRMSFGRARSLPVSCTWQRGTARIRLHEFFREAPESVWDDLGAWLRSGRRARAACRRLDTFIADAIRALPQKAHRKERMAPAGAVHDLTALAAPLWGDWFAADFVDRARPTLTWGARRKSRARRSLQLGCFVPSSRVVRIHPVLDHKTVPAWFVSFVLYHEILHAALPDATHHGPPFRERERRHPDYARTRQWETIHLPSWIARARRGTY